MTSTAAWNTTVRVQRTIPAPPDRVYRAWLEPDVITRWMAPGSVTAVRAEVDERVGGRYRVWQGEGDVGGFECEILELDPYRRIVFNWGFVGPDRVDGPTFDSRLTLTFHEELDGTTTLTLVHEHLDDLHAAMPDVAGNVGPGWADVLDKLATLVETDK